MLNVKSESVRPTVSLEIQCCFTGLRSGKRLITTAVYQPPYCILCIRTHNMNGVK